MDSNLSVDDIKAMFADVARRFQDTERRFQDVERGFQETRQMFQELRQEMREERSEADRKMREEWSEADRKMREERSEADRKMREERSEADRKMREERMETDRVIREVSQQIGGLGNKFGSFTEGLALPSMQKILFEQFGMDTVSPSVRVSRNGKHLEIDVLAYTNGTVNAAYVVEVKSHLREEGIEQLLRILEEFADWFPEHKNKQLFGILAAVDIPETLRPKVWDKGLYLARIHNDLFELQHSETFVPRRFDRPGRAKEAGALFG